MHKWAFLDVSKVLVTVDNNILKGRVPSKSMNIHVLVEMMRSFITLPTVTINYDEVSVT